MATTRTFVLTDEPQVIADNSDSIAQHTFVVVNVTAVATGELLGADEQLGEGIPIDASEKMAFGLGGGESIYAAAPAADGVTLRVLSLLGA